MTLVYRKAVRQVQTPPTWPAPVVHNTIHQTVVHLHQVTYQQIQNRRSTDPLQRANPLLLFVPRAPQPRTDDGPDLSRPTQSAQRLLRLFSKQSAQQQLRPFYSEVVRSVLREERERYQTKPSQAISLIWDLLGRRHALHTLTRFYVTALERLECSYYPLRSGADARYPAAGVALHSHVYQRYVRRFWSREGGVPLRYTRREQPVADDLLRLPVARPALPGGEPPARAAGGGQAEQRPPAGEPSAEPRLSDGEFRALVRDVAGSLSRQTRLEALRRGGV